MDSVGDAQGYAVLDSAVQNSHFKKCFKKSPVAGRNDGLGSGMLRLDAIPPVLMALHQLVQLRLLVMIAKRKYHISAC